MKSFCLDSICRNSWLFLKISLWSSAMMPSPKLPLSYHRRGRVQRVSTCRGTAASSTTAYRLTTSARPAMSATWCAAPALITSRGMPKMTAEDSDSAPTMPPASWTARAPSLPSSPMPVRTSASVARP